MVFKRKTIDENKLRDLHGRGLHNSTIGRELQVSHSTIARRLLEIGLSSNFQKNVPMIIVNDKILCEKCFIYKEKNHYIYKKGKSSLRFRFCKECKADQWTKKVHENYESYIKKQIHQIKHRASKSTVPYDLDSNYLIGLWDYQFGKCFYTDQPLNINNTNKHNYDSASLDKIVPSLGYVKGNVVWCSQRANVVKNDLTLQEMKKWMPDWHKRIEIFLNSEYNVLRTV